MLTVNFSDMNERHCFGEVNKDCCSIENDCNILDGVCTNNKECMKRQFQCGGSCNPQIYPWETPQFGDTCCSEDITMIDTAGIFKHLKN
jgi:hypothetical protein